MAVSPERSKTSLLTLAEVAQLLDCPRLRVWWSWKLSESLPAPVQDEDVPLWSREDVEAWMLRHGMASLVALRSWPAPKEPASYYGAVQVDDAMVQVWSSDGRKVAVVWPGSGTSATFSRDRLPLLRRGAVNDREGRFAGMKVDAVVVVGLTFGSEGPEVSIYRTGQRAYLPLEGPSLSERSSGAGWAALSRVLGQPAPFWPARLRESALITAWEPGRAAVVAPCIPDMDVTAFLRMAATFPAQHPAAIALTHLVQVDAWRGYSSALHELEDYLPQTGASSQTLTVAARPMLVPEVDTDDLDQTHRRLGWVEVLSRRDELASACVVEAMKWDGGRDFPYSQPEEIDTSTPAGKEWAGRLTPNVLALAFPARL